MNHDQIIKEILTLRERWSPSIAANAFASSLATRRLDWRSLLLSYSVSLRLEAHAFERSEIYSGKIGVCKHCGLQEQHEMKPNEYWEEIRTNTPGRHQHTNLQYVRFDLATSPVVDSSVEYRSLVWEMLHNIELLSENAQLTALTKAIPASIKSNKIERQHLLEILGFCGVLCPPEQVSYFERFVGFEEAELLQPKHFFKRDWAHPIRHWTSADGVDREAAQWWFGEDPGVF